ncbi:MAG: sulfotransferase [Parvularculaceae bacterium]
MARGPTYFICGALRSGTTLLRLMIDGHPSLSNPGEMDFLTDYPSDPSSPDAAAAYRATLRRSRIFATHALDVDETLDCVGLARSFVSQLRARAEGSTLTINAHRNFDRLLDIAPDARFVHLMRDPRDVARSSIAMGWAGSVYFAVDHWIASEKSMERLRGMAEANRICALRNEDLVRRPRDELARVCAFMDVDYDPAMLDYPQRSTYAAPDPSLVEQWRNTATVRELGLIEAKVGPLLTARGYLPSGASPVRPRGLGLWALTWRNRFLRIRAQSRRYGLGLVALEALARRARVGRLQDYAARRINAKAVLYLK